MVKKVQLPVVGGIRKTIIIPDASLATTLAGFAGQTLTVAQLRTLLGVSAPTNTGNGNIGPPGQGAAPKTAPQIMQFIFGDDGGGEGSPGPPGMQGSNGANGATGSAGPTGPAVFMTAEPGEDGWPAVPGNPGPAGANGTSGGPGPAGPAVMFFAEDGTEGEMGPPGPAGPAGSSGGGGSNPFNVTPDTHTGTPGNVANDEYETGSSIDTAGTRFVSAIPWTVQNAGAGVNSVANGSLLLSSNAAGVNNEWAATQPITSPTGAFEFIAKQGPLFGDAGANQVFSGIGIVLASTGSGYYFGRYTAATGNLLVLTQTTYSGVGVAAAFNGAVLNMNQFAQLYLKIGYNGTTLTFSASYDGIIYFQVFTAIAAGFDSFMIHIGASAQIAGWTGQVSYDFARRTL